MAALVPELHCKNIKKSVAFYTEILGFSVKYERPEEGFAYLQRGEAEIMLDQLGKTRDWISGPLEYPFGRGVNFQIKIEKAEQFYKELKNKGCEFFLDIEDKSYRCGEQTLLSRQFIISDPDGYLLRFFEAVQ